MASSAVRDDSHVRYAAAGCGKPARYGQALFPQECRVEQLGLIAAAVVAEDRHDGVPRSQLSCQPDRASDVHTRRRAEAQPFLLDEAEDRFDGLLVLDQVGAVDRGTPARFFVMRPWPMPSVMELPEAFNSPVV